MRCFWSKNEEMFKKTSNYQPNKFKIYEFRFKNCQFGRNRELKLPRNFKSDLFKS